MDRALIPEGLKRCPLPIFGLWTLVLVGVIGWGVLAGGVVLLKAMNVTGLNDYFGFGAYITADLAIIALGAGAFFSGFLYYGLSRFFPALKELGKIINLAVVVGFVCYTGALAILLLEIGQPSAGLVRILACKRPLDADGSYLLHQLLCDRPDHRICSDNSREPPDQRGEASPGVRTQHA